MGSGIKPFTLSPEAAVELQAQLNLRAQTEADRLFTEKFLAGLRAGGLPETVPAGQTLKAPIVPPVPLPRAYKYVIAGFNLYLFYSTVLPFALMGAAAIMSTFLPHESSYAPRCADQHPAVNTIQN